MLKWLATAAVAAVLTTGVLAAQPSQAAESKLQSTLQGHPAVVLALPDQQISGQAHQSKPSADPPPWYATFKQPEGMLVIVGVFTFFVIGYQSWETRKSAKAALLNAQAVLNSERAWLTAEVLNFGEPPENGKLIWIEVPITNCGKTSARLVRIAVTSKLVPVPNSITDRPGKLLDRPDYSDTNRVIDLVGYDLILAPGDIFRHMHTFIYPSEWPKIKAKEVTLYVYGRIEYLDTVMGDRHETGFCSLYALPEPNVNEPTGFMFSPYIPNTYFRAT